MNLHVQANDITDLGTLKEAVKIFVPGSFIKHFFFFGQLLFIVSLLLKQGYAICKSRFFLQVYFCIHFFFHRWGNLVLCSSYKSQGRGKTQVRGIIPKFSKDMKFAKCI